MRVRERGSQVSWTGERFGFQVTPSRTHCTHHHFPQAGGVQPQEPHTTKTNIYRPLVRGRSRSPAPNDPKHTEGPLLSFPPFPPLPLHTLQRSYRLLHRLNAPAPRPRSDVAAVAIDGIDGNDPIPPVATVDDIGAWAPCACAWKSSIAIVASRTASRRTAAASTAARRSLSYKLASVTRSADHCSVSCVRYGASAKRSARDSSLHRGPAGADSRLAEEAVGDEALAPPRVCTVESVDVRTNNPGVAFNPLASPGRNRASGAPPEPTPPVGEEEGLAPFVSSGERDGLGEDALTPTASSRSSATGTRPANTDSDATPLARVPPP